ncbi:MAG TPA: alpha/beta fold hydrolase [Ktedonobacterales bacterium]|nr:alpha/beta fold hydrolase [Ktedonobacterales bacterium]
MVLIPERSSEVSGPEQPTDQQEVQPVRCLLAHGLNGEPADLREIEERLAADGYLTQNLLLPGHGTSLRDFAAYGWADWYGAVRAAAGAARERGERVLLIGHSMGAGISLAAAADVPEVAGVVALCPPLRLWRLERPAVAFARHIVPYLPGGREDVRDHRGARLHYPRDVYRWTATAALYSMLAALPALRAALPRVRCPALVVCARHDHVVPMRDGVETYALLGSAQKDLLVLEASYHAVTKDVERQLVLARVLAFCAAVRSAV